MSPLPHEDVVKAKDRHVNQQETPQGSGAVHIEAGARQAEHSTVVVRPLSTHRWGRPSPHTCTFPRPRPALWTCPLCGPQVTVSSMHGSRSCPSRSPATCERLTLGMQLCTGEKPASFHLKRPASALHTHHHQAAFLECLTGVQHPSSQTLQRGKLCECQHDVTRDIRGSQSQNTGVPKAHQITIRPQTHGSTPEGFVAGLGHNANIPQCKNLGSE